MGLLAWSLCIGAQQRVKGLVVDAQGEPLAGIVVKALAGGEDRLMGYAVSDGEGRYEISLAADHEATRITLSGMGFRQVERKLGRGTTDLGRITREEAELELREVTVKAPPVRTTGDTITYNVAQLKDKSDRTIEDVIKKIPGVEVDQQGRIKYQGEDINKFYIEGLDMLGGRYTLASQNISPDDIASISVYENHQPKRVLQGLEYSKQAALNLKMKRSSMLRPIVTATVGAGYGDEVLGLAEATGLFVAPGKQYLLTANASASYRNPLRGNNFMLSAQYQYGRSNRTSGSDVSPSATETLWSNTKSSTGTWLVNLSATKNLLGYATVLTASANLATLSTQSIRQGAAYRLSNNTLTLRGNSHTTLLNRRLIIDADLFYTLSAQKIEIDTEGNLRNEITPSLRLTASPVDDWEIYARANMGYIENDRGRYDDNIYLDAGVRYTHKRFEAELSGKNLTNRRDYTVRRYAVLDRFTYHYSLRPVEVLLSFRFKI